MDGNGWKWMEMDGNGWKWMEMDGNGWKWMEMDGNGWKCGISPAYHAWTWLYIDHGILRDTDTTDTRPLNRPAHVQNVSKTYTSFGLIDLLIIIPIYPVVIKRGNEKSIVCRWFVQLETSTGDFQLATFDYQGVLLEFLVSNSGWSTTNPKENGGV